MNSKKDLRNIAKEIRKSLDMDTISSLIVSNIRKLKEYNDARKVMIYYPLENEVNLLDLLSDNKDFYLPRMSGSDLCCCPYNSGCKLNVADFGVKEPNTESVDKNLIDIIFVPALCVDKNCMRIGYGKGYYDRFLIDYKGHTIIPIPEELVFDKVCSIHTDVPCKKAITQNGVFCS